jgi:putative sterol carrier protein
VLRQLVTGTPEGTDVGYDVVVHGGRAVIRPAGTDTPSVTFTSDYTTATAVASGEMSTTAALAAGRLRVAGDVAALAALASELAGLDPLPADVRAETEWAP